MQPDVVLMDIHILGEMDGIEAASSISNELGIPIVFMSGYGDEQIMERARALNASSFLKKPLDDPSLLAALQAAFKQGVIKKRTATQ